MSNKNIRLNITADTSKAKKQIEDLKRDFGNGKLEFGKTGEKYKDSQDFSNGLNELSGVLTEINTNFKDLSATLREFVKQNTSNNKKNKAPKISDEEKARRKELKEQEKLAKEKEKQLAKELKAKEKLAKEQQRLQEKEAKEQQRLQEKEAKEQAKLIAQRAKEEAKKKQDQQQALNEYGNKVTKTASLIFASMNLKSYGSNAMATAQSNNVTSMSTYGRLGIYGKDFAKGTKDAYKIGAGLGYNATDTIGLQDQLLRNTGFSTKDKLDTDTTALQRFSKAYNLDTNESMPMYSELVKRGGLGPGQAEEMSKVVSTSIAKQGMEGRESEQVKAINQIFDVITSGKINVTSQDLKTSASLLDALGKQNAALKGEKGAQFLSKVSNGLNYDYKTLRMAGYGKNGKVGPEAAFETMKLLDEGFSNPELIKNIKENLPEMTGGDPNSVFAKYGLMDTLHLNATEAEEFNKLLNNNDIDAITSKYDNSSTSDQEAILQNIEGSKTNAREVHQIRKEEALNSAGNGLINAASGLNAMYDSMPTGMRVAGDIGGNILGGAVQGIFMSKALKGIGNYAKVLKGGESEVISSGIKSGIFSKGLGSLKGSSVLGNLTSSGAGSSSGKLAELLPKVGKVGVALPAVIGGVQATRSFIKGDKEKGSEQLGRGLGTTGGMIAGAKIGGAIGSMIPVPVLGTAAGVIGGAAIGGLGGFLGGKVGKGTYKLFSKKGSKNQEDVTTTTDGTVQYGGSKKENELLAWKERLLKKEEEIFDNFLNQNKESKKESKENPNDSKNEEPAVDKFYGDTLLKNDSPSDKNNVVGNVLESLTGKPAPSISSSDSSSVLDIKQIPGLDKLPKETQAELNKIIGNLSSKKQKLVKEILPGAIESYNKYGIFPSVTLGQAALESNWGNSGLTQKYNNAFGIKASKGWTGKVARMGTAEYGKNGRYNIKANFRAYDDINQSVLDHGEFLQKNARYKNNGVFSAKNSQEQIKAIARARYATDPNYANSTYKLMESNGFVDIDKILAKSSIKSYAIGTDKVDKDQLAFIHKDEAVLNKFDANEYRQQGSSQGGTINLNFNINGAGTSQENLTETIQNAVKQALQRLGLNNGGQVNLSKSYYRYQN